MRWRSVCEAALGRELVFRSEVVLGVRGRSGSKAAHLTVIQQSPVQKLTCFIYTVYCISCFVKLCDHIPLIM